MLIHYNPSFTSQLSPSFRGYRLKVVENCPWCLAVSCTIYSRLVPSLADGSALVVTFTIFLPDRLTSIPDPTLWLVSLPNVPRPLASPHALRIFRLLRSASIAFCRGFEIRSRRPLPATAEVLLLPIQPRLSLLLARLPSHFYPRLAHFLATFLILLIFRPSMIV